MSVGASGSGRDRIGRVALRTLPLAAALLLMAPADGQAQDVRGRLLTSGRYVEIRPLLLDTVPVEATEEGPGGVREYQGRRVVCIGRHCTLYRSGEPRHAVTLTQDLSFTAWGLGVQGLSGTAMLRGRANLDGALVWPRSSDPFDAILAYAELARPLYRLRVGRQRTSSGLGFSGYDGVEARLQPLGWLRLEGYGGRSLARGLEEPRHQALAGIEDFLPDRDAYLVGASVDVEPALWGTMTLRYQREIWSSRAALVSERAALDARTSVLRPLRLEGAVDYDVAFGHVGKAHLRAQLPLLEGRLSVTGTARRYLPYFELWTIWGFFSPVAYREVEIQARWARHGATGVWASAGLRQHEDAHAPILFTPLTDDATRLSVGGGTSLPGSLRIEGSYRLENGFGAFLSAGDASLTWRPAESFSAGLRGSAFQQIMEFRVGEGVVLGGGAWIDALLPGRLRLAAGVDLYRHTFENRPAAVDWNQTRGWTSLEIGFGRDPGLAGRGR